MLQFAVQTRKPRYDVENMLLFSATQSENLDGF